MANFKSKGDDLYIDDKKIIKAWESWTGWYWFGAEVDHIQDSVLDGGVVENDKIWYGFVQGFDEEWGLFSQGEIESLGSKAWEIPKANLIHSGRR